MHYEIFTFTICETIKEKTWDLRTAMAKYKNQIMNNYNKCAEVRVFKVDNRGYKTELATADLKVY
jgi:hypothetical protein